MEYIEAPSSDMSIFWKNKKYYEMASHMAYEKKTIDGYVEDLGFIVKEVIDINMADFFWFNRVAYNLEIPTELKKMKSIK